MVFTPRKKNVILRIFHLKCYFGNPDLQWPSSAQHNKISTTQCIGIISLCCLLFLISLCCVLFPLCCADFVMLRLVSIVLCWFRYVASCFHCVVLISLCCVLFPLCCADFVVLCNIGRLYRVVQTWLCNKVMCVATAWGWVKDYVIRIPFIKGNKTFVFAFFPGLTSFFKSTFSVRRRKLSTH